MQRGDTLSGLSRRFGTTTGAIARVNNLSSAHRIYIGQALVIPGQAPASFNRAQSSTQKIGTMPSVHVVRRGENLAGIARRYGTDVDSLASLNQLKNPDLLTVGTSLRVAGVPTTESRASQHVVRRGENLTLIARRYGTTTSALREYNSLSTSVLQPGQILRLP